ncbi:unnamed protein product [Allacma fusca]|uniref:Major facilitator superfamily (MFS) profile domain-containing protein n=1 Tax=Allacma fusca TaxID=39272 RepID=A0A8J2KIS2_9HEXA|nr:unnamed protein product [Allacma fusca]
MERVYKFFLHPTRRSEYQQIDDEDANNNLSKSGVEKNFVPKRFPQYLATFIATIGTFSHGNSLGWSAPALPNIEKNGDFENFKSNSDIATWIGAITLLGCFFSGFFVGIVVQRIGRKWTLLANGPIFIVGWLCIAFAPEVEWILAGRFITGFCGAGTTLTVLIYVSEISEANIRGTLCNAIGLAAGIGTLTTTALGSYIPWNTLSFINAFIPVIFTIGVIFIPESPQFLLAQGKVNQAITSLKWLRGATSYEEIRDEFNSIKARKEKKDVKFSELMCASVLKPFGICLMLMFFQQFGGIKGVMFYSVDVFKYAGTNIDANLSAITIAAVQVFFLFLSTLTVEKWGRRNSIMFSELGMALSLIALGVYFYLKENVDQATQNLGWLPLTSLIVYVLCYNLGVGPVTWTLMGELLHSNGKGLTSSITTAFSYGMAFLITKLFIDMQAALTSYGCYWFFASVSFLGFIFCFVALPETKGKNLLEIQQIFAKDRLRD